jgi:hypothetical protein
MFVPPTRTEIFTPVLGYWGRSVKGGQGSGNFDHEGRPGQVGGSAPTSGRVKWTLEKEGPASRAHQRTIAAALDQLPPWLADGIDAVVIHSKAPWFQKKGTEVYAVWTDSARQIEVYPKAFTPWAAAQNESLAGLLAHEAGHGFEHNFLQRANESRLAMQHWAAPQINAAMNEKFPGYNTGSFSQEDGPKRLAERYALLQKFQAQYWQEHPAEAHLSDLNSRWARTFYDKGEDGVTMYSQQCKGNSGETFAEFCRLFYLGGRERVLEAGHRSNANNLAATFLDIVDAMGVPGAGEKGGKGSGNWKHEGRPGEVGGSAPASGHVKILASVDVSPEDKAAVITALDSVPTWLTDRVKQIHILAKQPVDMGRQGLLGEWENDEITIYPKAIHISGAEKLKMGSLDQTVAHECGHGVWTAMRNEIPDDFPWMLPAGAQRRYEQGLTDRQRQLSAAYKEWTKAREAGEDGFTPYSKDASDWEDEAFCEFCLLYHKGERKGTGGPAEVRRVAAKEKVQREAEAFLKMVVLMGAPAEKTEEQPELLGFKGGKGSGNWDHHGRPGEVGGSAPSGDVAPIAYTVDAGMGRAAVTVETAINKLPEFARYAIDEVTVMSKATFAADYEHRVPGAAAALSSDTSVNNILFGLPKIGLDQGKIDNLVAHEVGHALDRSFGGLFNQYLKQGDTATARRVGQEQDAFYRATQQERAGINTYAQEHATGKYERANFGTEQFASMFGMYASGGVEALQAAAAKVGCPQTAAAFLAMMASLEAAHRSGVWHRPGRHQGSDAKGGEGSGNWRHHGRPGEVGGSAPTDGEHQKASERVWWDAPKGNPDPYARGVVAEALDSLPEWLSDGIDGVNVPDQDRTVGYPQHTATYFAEWLEDSRTIVVYPLAVRNHGIETMGIGGMRGVMAHEAGHKVYDDLAAESNNLPWEMRKWIGEDERRRSFDGQPMLDFAQNKENYFAHHPRQKAMIAAWDQYDSAWNNGEDGVTAYSKLRATPWETFAEFTRLYNQGWQNSGSRPKRQAAEEEVRKAASDSHALNLGEAFLRIIKAVQMPVGGSDAL